MLNAGRRKSTGLAKTPVRVVMLKLQREQLEGKPIPIGRQIPTGHVIRAKRGYDFAQTRCKSIEVRKRVHAVLIYRLVFRHSLER